jgi:hypothetical protein
LDFERFDESEEFDEPEEFDDPDEPEEPDDESLSDLLFRLSGSRPLSPLSDPLEDRSESEFEPEFESESESLSDLSPEVWSESGVAVSVGVAGAGWMIRDTLTPLLLPNTEEPLIASIPVVSVIPRMNTTTEASTNLSGNFRLGLGPGSIRTVRT